MRRDKKKCLMLQYSSIHREIHRVSRYVLQMNDCFYETREATRLPTCYNHTVDTNTRETTWEVLMQMQRD